MPESHLGDTFNIAKGHGIYSWVFAVVYHQKHPPVLRFSSGLSFDPEKLNLAHDPSDSTSPVLFGLTIPVAAFAMTMRPLTTSSVRDRIDDLEERTNSVLPLHLTDDDLKS